MNRSISDFQFLNGGRNNDVASFTIDGVKLVCKRFSQIDKEDRFLRETSFLNYCAAVEIFNTPKVYQMFAEENAVILTYLDGVHLQHFCWDYIEALCDFIEQLNLPRHFNRAMNLPFAADALNSMHFLDQDIEQRFVRLNEHESTTVNMLVKPMYEIYSSIKKSESNKSRQKFITRLSLRDLTPIVSPSDIGIHNHITTSDGPAFLDFEYAGLDSPLKLFVDLWTHPDLELSKENMSFIHTRLRGIFRFELDSIDRNIVQKFAIKWCLIMLKNLRTVDDVSRIMKYADRFELNVGLGNA